MTKKILLLALVLFYSLPSFSQREFWGTRSGRSFTIAYGSIFKTDGNGANATVVHLFDSIHGMKPFGRLLLASNGKLYGTASNGGTIVNPSGTGAGGVLFEYDLVLNQYKVLLNFGASEFLHWREPSSGVIEPIPGMLYGTTIKGGIFKYNINTQALSLVGNIPYVQGSILNPLNGELVKASNGYVYGATKYNSACPDAQPLNGSIVRVLPTNNTFQVIYPFSCSAGANGRVPNGSLVEASPGKLYGTTAAGGTLGETAILTSDGALFEYDIATNIYTKKFSFYQNTTGGSPRPLCDGLNGKLYGLLSNKGVNPANPNQDIRGTLYEYDISSNTITVLHYFEYSNLAMSLGSIPRGTLLRASDGKFYGFTDRSIFRFDSATGTVVQTSSLAGNGAFLSAADNDLIEICRKPSYQFFTEDTFTVCVNTPFSFDVQNTNATSYQWIKNGVVLPNQTSGVLNLSNISLADSGDYICQMVNECGTTTTMPLHVIAESCLGIDEAVGFKNSIQLFPNPAQDILNLQLQQNENYKVQQVLVRNMLGQIVYSSAENFLTIDVSRFTSGLYNVELKTDKGDWNGKFIKK